MDYQIPAITMTEDQPHADKDTVPIKPEFVVVDHVPTLVLDCVSADDKKHLFNDEEVPSKRQKYSKNKRVLKGQNKARGPTFKQDRENCLCPVLVDVPESGDIPVCKNEQCRFLHDVNQYLSSKPPDIGNECYVFSTHGYCPRGVTCRFGKTHLTEDGKNIRNCRVPPNDISNFLSRDLQHQLRKRLYDFSKSENILKKLDIRKGNAECESPADTSTGCEVFCKTERITGEPVDDVKHEIVSTVETATKLGPVDDSDLIKSRLEEKKSIQWKNKLVLSPLTTVGNLPFRRICKEFGADVTCGEMSLASSLLQGMPQEWALVRRHRSEDIFGVQLCGNNPYVMTRCAQLLQENIDIDFVDVNLGCPIDLIYRQGAGSGLLRRERVLENILCGMSHVLNVPLTVKTRAGIYKDQYVADRLIPKFIKSGVSMISIHGRTREQRYTKSADWDYIEKCAQLAHDVPVFGNGDILSFTDYNENLEKFPSINGVLIARGALYKPWIFTEIKEQRHWDISSSERMDIIKKYVNYGLEHWGSDDKGVENTRRFLLEWLSFLHRYVPVGLIERLPQKINQRPPVYRGRDELETLFASPNCQDWIRISEMLLGPVPEGFHFLPKHKASSWK